MSTQIEEQVQVAIDAIRAARAQPGGFDHQALIGLTDHIKASATGTTMKERRAFLKAVGNRLQEEAGPSQEVRAKGIVNKLRLWKDPDGQSIYDFGTILISMAKPR